ncbi:hypothetical protein C8F01DRAFT_1375772 [Mycena amicta]|nr:hypothetical protein C8F01DRAFT_1375772 [Mycena amicta]
MFLEVIIELDGQRDIGTRLLESIFNPRNADNIHLVDAIDSTKSILTDICGFNKDDWVVRYPQLKEEPSAGPDTLRRSLSFADDPANETPVRLGLTRSVTLASLSDAKEDQTHNPPPLSSDFHLEKSSIAHLLDKRLATSIAHIDKLRLRVQDTSSKVLVTGDLNAGKSTLVNAILRRQVMPVDQQSCTTAFCEADESTFTPAAVEDLEDIIAEYESKDSEHLLKTTALFACQEEIVVVVFVVSAENHFPLPAKEFLWTDDLVHFVDSASAADDGKESFAFEEMEAALRSFVLTKRSKSKLQPVETFLLNLLGDIELLASANKLRPSLSKMKSGRDKLEEGLESVEGDGIGKASVKAKKVLSDMLDQVGSGKPFGSLRLPSYPGLLSVWDYARDVRHTLLESLDLAVKLAEDEARTVTTEGVVRIKDLGEEHLPAGVELRRSKSTNGLKTRGKTIVVAGGAHGLGIGLASRSEMQEITFLQFLLHFGDGSKSSETDSNAGALSVVGVGVGALTMIGGQAIGVRGVIDSEASFV